MKYESMNLTEYKNIHVGSIRSEQQGKRTRWVKCKGICKGDDGNMYAHWQYVLASTFKPSGKSSSFLTKIP